jgi:hypothetical protein
MTWRSENSCPHRDSSSDPLIVQPVDSRYTDCAIPNDYIDSSSSSKNNNTNNNNKYRTVETARNITLNVTTIFLQVSIAFNEDLYRKLWRMQFGD